MRYNSKTSVHFECMKERERERREQLKTEKKQNDLVDFKHYFDSILLTRKQIDKSEL